ncbi:MAG: hypothetical protein J7K98_00760 [Candidatus Aenigmarchaeota archaeon]|nr:hypothetical protein [Candidatus Aenigmarchaeota archaeon]
MTEKFKKWISIAFFLLLISQASAQEFLTRPLEIALGSLPSSCYMSVDVQCIECIVFIKLIPLSFLTFLTFILVLVVIGKIFYPNKPVSWKGLEEHWMVILGLTFIISFAIMHFMNPTEFVENFGKIYDFFFWLKWGIIIGIVLMEYFNVGSRNHKTLAMIFLIMALSLLFLGESGKVIFQVLLFWLVFKLCWWASTSLTQSLATAFIITFVLFGIAVGVLLYFYPYISYFLDSMSLISLDFQAKVSVLESIITSCYG